MYRNQGHQQWRALDPCFWFGTSSHTLLELNVPKGDEIRQVLLAFTLPDGKNDWRLWEFLNFYTLEHFWASPAPESMKGQLCLTLSLCQFDKRTVNLKFHSIEKWCAPNSFAYTEIQKVGFSIQESANIGILGTKVPFRSSIDVL